MMITEATDAILCRGFFATLDGQAHDWFGSLPAGSISTFADLTRQFLSHFATSIQRKKQIADLCDLKQGSSESLAEYLGKWKKEVMGVADFDAKSAMVIFRNNLRSDAFHQDLIRFHRQKGHDTDECILLKRQIEQLIQMGYLGQFIKKPGQAQEQAQGQKQSNVWRKGGGQAPSTSAPPRKRDHHDHSSEEEEKTTEDSQPPRKRAIYVIFGGPEGGDSPAERKRWARSLYVGEVTRTPHEKKPKREPITFTDADLPNRPLPHRDAVVVKLDINNVVVHRVLVDTGSSVNVMYYDTFTQPGSRGTQLRQRGRSVWR
ncbi:PREDICTED: uncharacterized protein LOC109157215 [Ipomoea nil]|uniref:uncharacterized protein LOC109157215 n=1 Tax=Ipomoea nil TaxID=35883 RepID=UPI000901F241|nr:PREDICTED: uncharacterized protein LOC109157215 [Ipomoea nil]